MAPNQSKADALLSSGKSTTVVKSNKRNPYATSTASTLIKSKAAMDAKGGHMAGSSFMKRNARDKITEGIPQTRTDQLLMGLLDGKSKPQQKGSKQKSEAKGNKRQSMGTKRSLGSSGSNAERESKRAHSDSFHVLPPPPVRTYPTDIKKKPTKRLIDIGRVHEIMPPPARSYPNNNKGRVHEKAIDAVYSERRVSENKVDNTQIDSLTELNNSHEIKAADNSQGEDSAIKSFSGLTDDAMSATNTGTRDGGASSKQKCAMNSDALKPVNGKTKANSTETKPLLLLGRNRKNPRALSSGTVKQRSVSIQEVGTQSKQSTSSYVAATQSSISLEAQNEFAKFDRDGTVNLTDSIHNNVPPKPKVKHAAWYDAEDHAAIKASSKPIEDMQAKKSTKKPTSAGINDNFVRLDLKNSAGSCRGARNLKKVNKQKAWRAKYRFGKGDGGEEECTFNCPLDWWKMNQTRFPHLANLVQ